MTKMSSPGLDPRGKIKEGFLVKSPPLKPVLRIERRWHQRWFVLYDPNVSGNLSVSCPGTDKYLYYFKCAGEKKWIVMELDTSCFVKQGFLIKSPPPERSPWSRWQRRWFILYDPTVALIRTESFLEKAENRETREPEEKSDPVQDRLKPAGRSVRRSSLFDLFAKKWVFSDLSAQDLNTPLLLYYEQEPAAVGCDLSCINKIILRPGTRVEDRRTPVAGYEHYQHVIDLITKDRLFHLCAADAAEKSDWYRLLKLHVEGEDVGRDRENSMIDERGTLSRVCYSDPDNELARRVRMAKEENRRDGLDPTKPLSERLSSARCSDADQTDIVAISGAALNQIQISASDQKTQERKCGPTEWSFRVSDPPLETDNLVQYVSADSPNRLSGVVSQGLDRAVIADPRLSPRRMDTFRFDAATVDSCQSEEGANSCITDDLYCNPRLLAVSPHLVGKPVPKPRQKCKSTSMIDESTKIYQNSQSDVVPGRARIADKVRIKSESALEYKSGKHGLDTGSSSASGLIAENELYESADDATADGSFANVDDGISLQQQVDTGHYKTVSRRFHPVESDDVMRPASAFILRESTGEDEMEDELESPHYEQIPASHLDFGNAECPDKDEATRNSSVENSSPMSKKVVSGLRQDLCRKRSLSHGDMNIRDSARERNEEPKRGMAVQAWNDRSDLYFPDKDSLSVQVGAKPAGSTSPNAFRPLCATPPPLPRHANVPCPSVDNIRASDTAPPVPQHGAPPPRPRRIGIPLTDGPPAREKAATAQFEMTIVRRRAQVSSSLPDRTRQKMPLLESFETIRIDWTRGSTPREPLYAKVGRLNSGEVADNLRRNRSVDSNLHLDSAENGGSYGNAGDTCESYVRRRTHSDVTVEACYVNASEYRVRKYK